MMHKYMLLFSKFFKRILSLSTFKRRIVLILFDYILVLLCLIFSVFIDSQLLTTTIKENSLSNLLLISLLAIVIYFLQNNIRD